MAEENPITQSPSKSPSKDKARTEASRMDIHEALKQMLAGKRVTKLEWNNKNMYGILEPTQLLLMIKRPDTDNKLHPWPLSEGDLLGEDWIVL